MQIFEISMHLVRSIAATSGFVIHQDIVPNDFSAYHASLTPNLNIWTQHYETKSRLTICKRKGKPQKEEEKRNQQEV